MSMYKVIWFDDEHESLSIIRERAFLNDILLFGFNNASDGIEELTNNIKSYDAAIVDGLFFRSSDSNGTNTSDKALFDVARAIEGLSPIKKLPWFILSGQMSFTKETHPYADGYKENVVYDKLSDDDLEKLWQSIKKEADEQVDTQIRFRHRRVFDLCTEEYIGEAASQDLLKLLKDGEEANLDNDLNRIRKLVEDLFMAFHSCHLLPSDFVTPRVSLNESSKFLAGKNNKGETGVKGYTHLEDTHLPEHIASHVRGILSITQSGSHRSDIDKYAKEIKSPYLFKSVLYQLMDVLVWFKMYVDSGPKTKNWTFDSTTFLPGKVLRPKIGQAFAFFAPNNGGNRAYISKDLVDSHGLTHESFVNAEIEEYTDANTDDKKYKVKRIQIQ